MMQRLIKSWSLFALILSMTMATARADVLYGPNSWMFKLPDIGVAWEQEIKGDLVIITDETDKLPELTVAVFPPSKDGTIAEIEARMLAELVRLNLSFYGEKVVTFKVENATTETISGANVRIGTARVNKQPAAFAIAQRPGTTVILVGVGKEGVSARALSNFAAIVRGLGSPRRSVGDRGTGPSAPPVVAAPKLAAHVGLRDVSATSTFKSKKDLYGAWRALMFEETDDELGAPKTAWCEGKPDEGIGEAITIVLDGPTKLDTIEIAAGVWLTPKLFSSNNRITSLAVSFDGAPPSKVTLPTTRAWTTLTVGRAVSSITIKIDAVAKGKMNDSCISGVKLVRGGKRVAPLRGLDAGSVAALPSALASLYKALGDEGRPGLDKVIGFPFVLRDSSSWGYGDPPPVKYTSAKALVAACKAYDAQEARGIERDESKGRTCPTTPYIKDDNADLAAEVESLGPGRIAIVFPSGREVRDEWYLGWVRGAWKLTAIGFR